MKNIKAIFKHTYYFLPLGPPNVFGQSLYLGTHATSFDIDNKLTNGIFCLPLTYPNNFFVIQANIDKYPDYDDLIGPLNEMIGKIFHYRGDNPNGSQDLIILGVEKKENFGEAFYKPVTVPVAAFEKLIHECLSTSNLTEGIEKFQSTLQILLETQFWDITDIPDRVIWNEEAPVKKKWNYKAREDKDRQRLPNTEAGFEEATKRLNWSKIEEMKAKNPAFYSKFIKILGFIKKRTLAKATAPGAEPIPGVQSLPIQVTPVPAAPVPKKRASRSKKQKENLPSLPVENVIVPDNDDDLRAMFNFDEE